MGNEPPDSIAFPGIIIMNIETMQTSTMQFFSNLFLIRLIPQFFFA